MHKNSLLSQLLYDAVVSGLVLNFIPKPTQALSEIIRAVRIGGIVQHTYGIMQTRCNLFATFGMLPWHLTRTAASALDERQRFPLCQPEPLRQLFQTTHVGKVEVRSIDVPTTFRDFDDYWSPFLGGQGPAPSYVVSLPEEQRVVLREHIKLTLPIAA